jgi:L,D-transpeptidase-like protein
MRKELIVSLAIIVITATGYGLLTSRLTSQDTTFQGYLSGLLLNFWGGDQSQVIRVNLRNSMIALYENDSVYTIAKIAGAGNPFDVTATPTGKFRILSKEIQHISRLSGVIMPLSMRFFEGYYFHDIPLTPDGYLIRTRYSHGCIRLPHDLAQKMFQWVRIGAHVEIYNATLVRAEHDQRVYWLSEDGQRRPIASEASFIANGFRWEDVVVVPPAEVYGLPIGATL